MRMTAPIRNPFWPWRQAFTGALLGALLMYGLLASPVAPLQPTQAAPSRPPRLAISGQAAALQDAVVHATQRIRPSVVNIDTSTSMGMRMGQDDSPFDPSLPFGPHRFQPRKGQGSGVIVSSDGLILTNDHVVRGATEVVVTLPDQRKFPAALKGADRLSDIALLKINARGLPAAPLGDSENTPIGAFVIAVGNPFGFSHTTTMGVLSGKGREIPEPGKELSNLLQTDAAINPGNSGGPLVDLDGNVIGINTAIISQAQGMGFAIPISTARDVMYQLLARGKVIRPYIGIVMQAVTDEVARYLRLPRTNGVLVSRVMPNSPAASAGLARGDVILEIDGVTIEEVRDFQKRVRNHKVGDAIALKVWSGSRVSTLKLRVQEMPSS